MPKKTIFIFITVFIIVGAIMLGIYFFKGSSPTTQSTTNNTGTNYQTFNPFGSGTQTTPTNNQIPASSSNTTTQTQQTTPIISKFHQITDFAVAGVTFFQDNRPLPITTSITNTQTDTSNSNNSTTNTKKTASTPKTNLPQFEVVPAIRYVERVTGHIYEMYLDTKAISQISNSTIPGIYEALFDSTAKTVIYRYISTDDNSISSYMATLGGTQGQFLPPDITDLSISPDKTKFFYLIQNKNGVVGTIKSFTDTKTNQIFSSPYTEWLSQWVTPQKIFLTTKASYSVPGYLFSLSTSDGSLTKIFGGVDGLTTLVSNDGTMTLYSSSLDTGPRLEIYDINKNISNDTGVYGLPEKCVWSNDGINVYCAIPNFINGSQYPDSWYQGLVSFNDYFVEINTKTLQITQIENESNSMSLDATHLLLSSAEDKLFFINKKDSTLWSLDLK